jgi:hypothetical protein
MVDKGRGRLGKLPRSAGLCCHESVPLRDSELVSAGGLRRGDGVAVARRLSCCFGSIVGEVRTALDLDNVELRGLKSTGGLSTTSRIGAGLEKLEVDFAGPVFDGDKDLALSVTRLN